MWAVMKSGSLHRRKKVVYEEIQKIGGNTWDTSSLIRRFKKK